MFLLNTLLLAAAVAAVTPVPKAKLKVSSTAFANNGSIPMKYSCEGEEVSPPLTIDDVPAGSKSLAIVLHDPDAPREGGFRAWVVYNIDVANKNIPENFKGGEQGLNGAGKPGYKGMCPPTGEHHYHFIVYALDITLNADAKTDKAALEKNIQGHILAQGELVGLYKKSKQ